MLRPVQAGKCDQGTCDYKTHRSVSSPRSTQAPQINKSRIYVARRHRQNNGSPRSCKETRQQRPVKFYRLVNTRVGLGVEPKPDASTTPAKHLILKTTRIVIRSSVLFRVLKMRQWQNSTRGLLETKCQWHLGPAHDQNWRSHFFMDSGASRANVGAMTEEQLTTRGKS